LLILKEGAVSVIKEGLEIAMVTAYVTVTARIERLTAAMRGEAAA
jgi:hypothetical protein